MNLKNVIENYQYAKETLNEFEDVVALSSVYYHLGMAISKIASDPECRKTLSATSDFFVATRLPNENTNPPFIFKREEQKQQKLWEDMVPKVASKLDGNVKMGGFHVEEGEFGLKSILFDFDFSLIPPTNELSYEYFASLEARSKACFEMSNIFNIYYQDIQEEDYDTQFTSSCAILESQLETFSDTMKLLGEEHGIVFSKEKTEEIDLGKVLLTYHISLEEVKDKPKAKVKYTDHWLDV